MAKKEENFKQDFEAQVTEEKIGNARWQEIMEKIKEKANQVKEKITPLKRIFSGRNITFVASVIIFIIVILIARTTLRFGQFKPPIFPSPSPTPIEIEITNPSAYATDSAVLEIENRLKEIEKEIEQIDLKETGLNPPVLDMEVNFEE